jgi:hypothetical protein
MRRMSFISANGKYPFKSKPRFSMRRQVQAVNLMEQYDMSLSITDAPALNSFSLSAEIMSVAIFRETRRDFEVSDQLRIVATIDGLDRNAARAAS